MSRILDLAIVYDITSNSERRKLDKLLKGYGFRVQKSVFECQLTPGMVKKLVLAINNLHLLTGWVKIYRLVYCKRHISLGGEAPPEKDKGPAYIV